MDYFRPIAMSDPARPDTALPLAGGWCWFAEVEVLSRGAPARRIAASALPPEVRDRLSAGRAPFGGLSVDRPRVMGILNVTPDSFSDGGLFLRPEAAVMQARQMAAGADIIDIGGESTRPGAAEVSVEDELARTRPVIAALRAGGLDLPLSIDTRKAAVAQATLSAGASWVNDVTALRFDPAMAEVVASAGCPVVLMHSVATPATMQDDPVYDDDPSTSLTRWPPGLRWPRRRAFPARILPSIPASALARRWRIIWRFWPGSACFTTLACLCFWEPAANGSSVP